MEPRLFKLLLVVLIELVAVAVAFVDFVGPIELGDSAV